MKHLVRRLVHAPLFTGVTLLTLAIGIGANTAIFSVLHGVLLKSLPYPQPDRLVGVWLTAPGIGLKKANAAPSTYFLWREEGRVFQDVGLWRTDTVSVTGIGEPQELDCLFVTERTLGALGVQPILGRGFDSRDDSPNGPENVLLTYGYWQRRFGGERNALGQRILVDGRAKEVIGVLPRDFRFMSFNPDMVLTFRLDRSKAFVGNFSYQALARLKDGVTVEQANADVARTIPMLSQKFPPAPGMSPRMLEEARLGPDVHPLKEDVVGDIGKVLWVLMGTVGMVLLIACANVANLLLVRAEGRQHELAIRAALGASRSQVAREILLESVSLGLLGGVLGLGLAAIGLRVLVALAPANLPRLDEISLDAPVLLFALAISLAAGVLFGLLPVMKYAGPRLAGSLRQGGRTSSGARERHRARNVLVVGQVALALVLLVSAGLMIRTIRAMKQVPPGFTGAAQILRLSLSIPTALVKDDTLVVRLEQNILDKVATIPGAGSVSYTTSTAMNGDGWHDPIYAETRVYSEGGIPPLRHYKFVAPGSFATMGNPLVAGRDITWTDIYEARPVLLVSENLARELWGSPGAAIGKRVRENPKGIWREVVGVAGNTRDAGVSAPPEASVYWPLLVRGMWGQNLDAQRYVALLVRSPRSGSAAFFREVQQAIWSVNPSLTIANVRTMQEIYDRSMARTSFTLVMLTIAAIMALLLGVVGIYGVISYSVSQRTREIGVRIALGAPNSAVRSMFVRDTLALTLGGLTLGLGVAIGLTRLMSALLFGVTPIDPLTFGSVTLILALAALAAGYLPARRATLVPPVEALRAE
jgi:putative ABC transport system permease protein